MPYPILDLSTTDVGVQVKGKADPKSLADQLTELRDALGPILAGPQATVQALVVSLTVDADGGLAFVTRGAPDASIVMTFTRPLV
ncbi:MAG TPA: hypothetical protein VGR49_03015 [Actinomycetota bacterium]|jgi:hypothetical protein|nr:hypothetical protein [Actinomycetota bacterium]